MSNTAKSYVIRWRLILLSPEEEDDIAVQLAGPGWFAAVTDILAQDTPLSSSPSPTTPKILPPYDWRVSWVEHTLRRLEAAIPVLQHEAALEPDWLARGSDDAPFPPPAAYPLRPRPRYSEYLRQLAEMHASTHPVADSELCEKAKARVRARLARAAGEVTHSALAGPPYSLMLVDRPDSANAFSYGFGPDGAGGIVVYSGFLDEVLNRNGDGAEEVRLEMDSPAPGRGQMQERESSWVTTLFGSLFSLSPAPPSTPAHPTPTAAQTEELAVLLAHELAHLILAHHIETLSSSSIILPGVLSIGTDIVRALLFPVTMLCACPFPW